jgi:hypothetical protein
MEEDFKGNGRPVDCHSMRAFYIFIAGTVISLVFVSSTQGEMT